MKQKTDADARAEVNRHTIGNRKEIEASKFAGCCSCCEVFNASDVQDWRDEWNSPEKQNRVRRWTAKCPHCHQATVIGSSTGLLENEAYLVTVKHIVGL